MMCLDVYLSGLTNKEYIEIKEQIKPSDSSTIPLLSWDIYSEHYFKSLHKAKHEIDIDKIKSFAKKYDWKNDFDTLFEKNEFEAIVITDLNKKIIWVNDGFTAMTGYSKKFAINSYPDFLQGALTSKKTKERIGQQIKMNHPFKEVIVNYRKDATTYHCEIKVFPLYNKSTTHFIAFEKQVG